MVDLGKSMSAHNTQPIVTLSPFYLNLNPNVCMIVPLPLDISRQRADGYEVSQLCHCAWTASSAYRSSGSFDTRATVSNMIFFASRGGSERSIIPGLNLVNRKSKMPDDNLLWMGQ